MYENNSCSCIYLSNAFLTLADGRVLKAVFATDGSDVLPIIAEEIKVRITYDLSNCDHPPTSELLLTSELLHVGGLLHWG